MTHQRHRHEDFHVAIICAVPCEYDAVIFAFDEIWDEDRGQLRNAPGDWNKYKTGRIGSHNVVLLLLPDAGKVSAASAASSLRSTYTGIKLALLTGICGGVPGVGTENELLLGDVVISKSILQYDLGRKHPDKFAPKNTVEDSLGRPSKDIRSLIALFQTRHGRDDLQRRTDQVLEEIQERAINFGREENLYKRPTATEDRLFEPDYLHRHRDSRHCDCSESGACEKALKASCEELQCDSSHLMSRRRLKKRKLLDDEGDASVSQELRVFVGRVGSGDTVMKSGMDRDLIAGQYDLIAFEMEGAGVWDDIACIVVKAVCDYADSHKNKKCQDFAAARAASTAKAILESYSCTDKPTAPQTWFLVPHHETEVEGAMHGQRQYNENERKLLQMLAAEHEAHKNFNPKRVPGTCEWFFRDHRFRKWLDSTTSSIIWVSAGPGCGKSVLARALVDEGRLSTNPANTTVCYFFFKDGQERRTRSCDALSAILHQLFTQTRASPLIRHAAGSFEKYGDTLRNNFYRLWQTLTDCAKDPDAGEIVCVLDALDECDKAGRQEILEVLETFYFGSQVHQSSSRLKVLITSRPYDDLEMSFEKLTTAESYIRFEGDGKSEEIRHEIDLVIDFRVNEFGKDFRDEHRRAISERLKAMENRTYLWLHLTLSIINEKRSAYRKPSSIQTLLSHLPSGVFDAYEKILSRSQDEKQARCLLQIILAATRPLTLDEVNYFLTLQEKGFRYHHELESELWPRNDFKSTARNLCGLFISVHDDKVSLIHQTAREFLTANSGPQNTWKGSFDIPLAHSTIFISCVRVLSLEDLDRVAQTRYRIHALALPFISYAALHWTFHYNSQDAANRDRFCKNARELCRISGGQTPAWLEFYHWEIGGFFRSGILDWTDLTFASHFGLLEVVIHILDREKVDINSQGGSCGTAVKTASAYGHTKLVQTLIQRGADCDIEGGYFRTALLAATSGGHTGVVECLLSESSGAQVTQEVIMAAVMSWPGAGKELMALLLEKCEDEVEITQEILMGVAKADKPEVMVLLLEKHGDKVDITQEVFVTAARFGSSEMIAFLLEEYGCKVEITEELIEAAAGNGKDVMGLLLERYGDKFKVTEEVFIAAAESVLHADEMMAFLLEKRGGELDITEQVLVAILSNGSSVEMMEMILEKIGDEDMISEEVLCASARNRHVGDKIMALLLKKFEITPRVVEAVAGNRHMGDEIMALLLEEFGDEFEITPRVVEAAARNSWTGEEMMTLLLEVRGDEVEITQEVVMAAAKEGGSGMMAFLLRKYGDTVKSTPGVVEAAAGNMWYGKEIMDLLIKAGIRRTR